jgi:hypothetical protein
VFVPPRKQKPTNETGSHKAAGASRHPRIQRTVKVRSYHLNQSWQVMIAKHSNG